jgi:hypothetical protein
LVALTYGVAFTETSVKVVVNCEEEEDGWCDGSGGVD